MSTPTDELAAAAQALRPSSPAVAAHTVAVRIPVAAADALADWLDEEARQLANDDFPALHEHALAVARALLARAINGEVQR
ncbi:hypothetical protein AB0K66_26900 [Streptomyces werraensis]|uniref:hypothetical protein n=1 Tax=Streptomyces werraensis TaxID=68284 RepID=UPI00342F194A